MVSGHDSVSISDRVTGGGHPSAASGSVREISVVDARKSFGVTKALDGCTFRAKCGEIHAIVGGNGSGKSTLAKILSGVLPADSGQVSVLGHTPLTPHKARSIGVATVFQEVLVAEECSVVDNLFVGTDSLWSKSLPTRTKLRTAQTLMKDLTGMDIDPNTMVGGLPLSIKQWITIGRALLCNPKVLILDESSAALDLDSTEKLFSKMRELRDQGAAVIIVTHRIAELIQISDRATVMRDGRDVGVLEKKDITEKNLLALMTSQGADIETSDDSVHQVSALSDDVVVQVSDMMIWPDGGRVEFNLLRGEIVGVAGLDGQGQNEFVRALAGVEPALQGWPRVNNEAGELMAIKNLDDARDCRIAYVSGDRKHEGIIPNLSIFENLLIPLYKKHLRLSWLGFIDWTTLSGVFNWAVERLSIKFAEKSNKITSLSGGNQQKVLIGRSFALQPDILVFNDPARGIDVVTKSELYKQIRGFASYGHSSIFLSSELEEFIGLCDRVLVFRHGSIFASFTGNEIDPVRLLEAMFGKSSERDGRPLRDTARDDYLRSKAVKIEDEQEKPKLEPSTDHIKVVEFDREKSTHNRDTSGSTPRSEADFPIKIVYSDAVGEAAPTGVKT